MSDNKEPTMGNGKICYIEIPSADVDVSVAFYQNVFGWNIRTRGDGSRSFDDGVGQVSGAWVLNRPPMTNVGLLIYIMVDSVAAAVDKVIANGGLIVQPSASTPLKSPHDSATLLEMSWDSISTRRDLRKSEGRENDVVKKYERE